MDNTLAALRAALLMRAKAQVISDALRHVFAPRPAERKNGRITTFGDLHDYVDANYYGGAFEEATTRVLARALHLDPDGEDTFSELVNQFFDPMQTEVNDWITANRFHEVMYDLRMKVRGAEETAHIITQIHAIAAGLPMTDATIVTEVLA